MSLLSMLLPLAELLHELKDGDQTQNGASHQCSGGGKDVAGQQTELKNLSSKHSSLSMARAELWDGSK